MQQSQTSPVFPSCVSDLSFSSVALAVHDDEPVVSVLVPGGHFPLIQVPSTGAACFAVIISCSCCSSLVPITGKIFKQGN